MAISLTVKVTNSGTTTTTVAPIVDTVTVDPPTAPTGTTRTITVAAHDTNVPAKSLTYSVTRSDGGVVTPTSQPNVFTTVI